MILNMSYGASQAQVIDFTVSSFTPIEITIPNVKISSGVVNGIMIYPVSEIEAEQEGYYYLVWYNPNVSPGYMGSKHYESNRYIYGEYAVGINPEITSAIIYDDSNNTLKVRYSANVNHGLPVGNYKLVVW